MKNALIKRAAASALVLALSIPTAQAQKKYDSGASDTEIKVGQTVPLSGPASAYAVIGKTQAAYMKMINDLGGVNGRKVNLIQYDDAYSPPKTVEQTRKLVESDEVLLTFQIIGTAPNVAVQKYLNAKKVPQLFAATGAARFTDPKNFPWTMGFNPSYLVEGRIYAQYLLKNYPNARIGVLYQNDDLGKDYLAGFKAGLGDKAKMIVAETSYEITEPTIDSQILRLKDAGADVLFSATTPKQAAQAIKKVAEIGWKPLHIIDINASSVSAVLKPAGLDNAKDVVSVGYVKDSADPEWKGRSRHEALSRLHGQVLSGRRQGIEPERLRLHHVPAPGAGAAAMPRRSHPRERDASGRQSPEHRARPDPARDFRDDKPDRLSRQQAVPDGAIRRPALAEARRHRDG
ncbi:branched-chain amino acid transport system substrate-binding protein [Bradyrhizobium sp. LB13.1]